MKLGSHELDECVRLVMEEFGDGHRGKEAITFESFRGTCSHCSDDNPPNAKFPAALLGGSRHEDTTKQQLKQLRFTGTAMCNAVCV